MSENNIKIATYIMIAAAFVIVMSIFMANIFTINSFWTAIPTMFILSLTAVFLFDSVYFIEFIDSPKTPFDLLLDFSLTLLILAIATLVYYDTMAPVVFVMLAAAFMVAVLKYWIASKRQHRSDVQKFIKKKAILDVIGACSYVVFAIVSFFFSFTAPYFLLITAAIYIGFMVYGTVTPFFNVEN
ncbi:MAG: hypothetical protein PHC66_05040 [Candidatus Nanoarchaeia archaeon]|nr:hypothetical protein [Candidatus Nanoarchaeia archaeon]MDD5238967.1 hypothetical protein [Candidatus Nanoarchaeia archaeon]